jgi:RND family efflux transporter MFP subunit
MFIFQNLRLVLIAYSLFMASGLIQIRMMWAEEIVVPAALIKLMDHAEIAAPEAGVIAELAVQEGDIVPRDELIARLDDTDAVLGEKRAQREVDIAANQADNRIPILAAEAELQLAENDLARAKESQQKFARSVSAAEMERFELAVRQGKLAVEQAEHELAIARLTLQLKQAELEMATRLTGRRQILAPFEGMVVQVYQRPGEWVEPGTQMVRLVRTDRLRVEGFVSVEQVASPLVGRRVTLTLPGPGGTEQTSDGQVTFVSPEVDPVNRQVRVLAEIDNQDQKLRPGLSARLVIHRP